MIDPKPRPTLAERAASGICQQLIEKLETTLRLIEECNELSAALSTMGYGADRDDHASDRDCMPEFELTAQIGGGWVNVYDISIVEDVYVQGLRPPKQSRSRRRKLQIVPLRSAAQPSC